MIVQSYFREGVDDGILLSASCLSATKNWVDCGTFLFSSMPS